MASSKNILIVVVVVCMVILDISTKAAAALQCKATKLGTEYNGVQSTTVTGRTCQNWAAQSPHKHSQSTGFPDGSVAEAKNYCRNPDKTSGGPWCYTADPKKRWEYCDVPDCDECKDTRPGVEYSGGIDKTINGRTCQNWESQKPHNHAILTKFPEGSEKAAKNYCRNPDNTAEGPWCYTTDPKVRWEYCNVKFCTKDPTIARQCKTTKLGTEYNGVQSTTVTGRTCQNWASKSPHSHSQTNFPNGGVAAAENYCRNPDSTSGGPWCYTADPKVRWEYCDIPTCAECKKTKVGTDYSGVISKTKNGLTCQSWVSQAPHNHIRFTNFPEGNEEAAKNYCRNPDNTPEGPWCYTTDPKVRWEYCDIPTCARQCKTTKLGTEYTGLKSTTVTGRTCQNWATKSPHSHSQTNFPDGSVAAAKNYCRNPDNASGGPWCYTTDPKVRWEYCDVKSCDQCREREL